MLALVIKTPVFLFLYSGQELNHQSFQENKNSHSIISRLSTLPATRCQAKRDHLGYPITDIFLFQNGKKPDVIVNFCV
jgi:hypothetical protein